MSSIFKYGDVLRPKTRVRGQQRVQFIRWITVRERQARQTWGALEFLGLTVRAGESALGRHKLGSLEYFTQNGWVLDDGT